uniref:Hexosyltransferase n=1 Tax=Naja naja TaxID=35670 RepID=A0A8C6YJR3_NAJNA
MNVFQCFYIPWSLYPNKSTFNLSTLSRFVTQLEACSNQEIFLLVLIFSSPQNLSRRNAIRKTWANVTHNPGYTTLVLFVLGKPSSATAQVEVIKESDQQQDLIQGIFLDTPENQTLKIKRAIELVCRKSDSATSELIQGKNTLCVYVFINS